MKRLATYFLFGMVAVDGLGVIIMAVHFKSKLEEKSDRLILRLENRKDMKSY